MFYKDQLQKAKENNINIWKTYIADEVDCVLDNSNLEATDNDFEECCKYVYNYCRYSQATPNEVANALVDVLLDQDLDFTFDDLENDELDQTVQERVCWR